MERKSVSTSNLPEGKQRSNLIQKLYENFLPTKQNYAPSIEVACEQKDEQKIIAIIGMGCRLSGGINSPEELWSNALVKGRSLAEPVPFSRWDVEADGANDGDIRSRTYQGAFVKDAEYFDPPTFKISMIEAENMDPQHRLLLECSCLALLDAGYSKGLSELRGKNVGVFIGISGSDMVEVNLMNKKIKRASVYEAYNAASSSASGRVSFVFNFKGPCVTFDAACSSSLVALHAGMQPLKNGECDLAVVAGVNIMLTSTVLKSCGLAKMTSPTGRCHTFDSSADGHLRGEGCAAVVLKSLDAAVEESVESFNSQVSKSSFHAVLSAVRVKHDGASASFTAPNLDAQTNLVYEARNYPEFNLEHKDIDYFECHGTGTPLGDPVEIEAIVSALNRQKTERHNNQTASFGSVKANIGHLEAGAGLAGLIAATLVLKHEKAPPNTALTELNPRIKRIIENSGIKCSFQTKLTSLRDATSKPENHPLIAGISSFGCAGTIAHAIIRQPKVFHVREKKIKTAQSLLLFTGQGSQYPRMGQKLYNENQDFRKAMDRCNTIYQKFNNGQSLLENIFTLSAKDLSHAEIAQPALVSLEWSLAEMWRANNVLPTIVLGHSVGEIAAACVAGAMSIDTALHLAIVRGKLMQDLPQNSGVMVAVRCSASDAKSAIMSSLNKQEQTRVGIARVNGPQSIVLSGARDVVEKVLMTIGKKGAYLQVSHAFYSPLMQEMEEEFRVFASSLDVNQPLSVPMASTVNGKIIAAGEILTVEHWVTQIASPVLFESSFTNAMNDHNFRQTHIDVIVEIGPNAILSAMARSWWKPDDDQNSPLWIASLERKRDKIPETIASVKAYLGKNLHSTNLLESVFPNRVRIPWVKDAPHPLLQRSVSHSRGVEYHTTFHDKLMSFYKNHLINDKMLFPTAGMIEAGLAAGVKRCDMNSSDDGHQVEMLGVEFSMAFEIKTGSKMLCEHYSHGKMELRVESNNGDYSTFATIQQINTAISHIAATTPLKYWKKCHTRQVPGVIDRYEMLAAKGFYLGDFQSISSVWLNEDHKSVLGQIILPTDHKHKHDGFYHARPASLDGVLFVLHRPLSIASDVWACVKVKRFKIRCNVSNEFSYDISCVKSTRFSTQHYFCCRHFLLCFFLFLLFTFNPCC